MTTLWHQLPGGTMTALIVYEPNDRQPAHDDGKEYWKHHKAIWRKREKAIDEL